jgi:hypothetical protein
MTRETMPERSRQWWLEICPARRFGDLDEVSGHDREQVLRVVHSQRSHLGGCCVLADPVRAVSDEMNETQTKLAGHLHLEHSRVDGCCRKVSSKHGVVAAHLPIATDRAPLEIDPIDAIHQQERVPVRQDLLEVLAA